MTKLNAFITCMIANGAKTPLQAYVSCRPDNYNALHVASLLV